MQDIDRVVNVSYEKVYRSRGIALQHVARSGRRRQEVSASSIQNACKRGGKRIKRENYDWDGNWIQPSVEYLIDEGFERSEFLFSQNETRIETQIKTQMEPNERNINKHENEFEEF